MTAKDLELKAHEEDSSKIYAAAIKLMWSLTPMLFALAALDTYFKRFKK